MNISQVKKAIKLVWKLEYEIERFEALNYHREIPTSGNPALDFQARTSGINMLRGHLENLGVDCSDIQRQG